MILRPGRSRLVERGKRPRSLPDRLAVEQALSLAQMSTIPPSTFSVCPVTNALSSEQRNATGPAMSPGSPIRAGAVLDCHESRTAGPSGFTRSMSVRMMPGQMQFAVMPKGPTSCARTQVKPMTAAFDAE